MPKAVLQISEKSSNFAGDMRKVCILFLTLSLSFGLYAQDSLEFRSHWFHYTPYGQSLYADVHPDFFRFDIAPTPMREEYNYAPLRTGWHVQTYGIFGAKLPVWNGDFSGGRYGLSVSQSVSATIWMDLFEPVTSPIVNTDYRIAVPTATFIHRLDVCGLTKGKFLRNYSVAFTPFKHESTHIGDEMVLQRSDKGYALRRVNVSYNYAEAVFTLNEPEDRRAMTHTFRVGLLVLLKPSEGWYWIEPRDGDVNSLPSDKAPAIGYGNMLKRYGPSRMPVEVWLQYQFQSPCSKHGFQGIASAEVRNRALYGYDLTATTNAAEPIYTDGDPRRFTYNVFVGARYNMRNYDGIFSRFALGLRAYYGVCPYGMFRSVDKFTQIGVCFIYQ